MDICKPGQRECRRCGTCCRSGGPSLHREDRGAVEAGDIPLRHLFTIRIGEPVHENVSGRIVWADAERIKIRGTGAGWTCVYYREDDASCHIYDLRPAECRAMKCWDTEPIEALYRRRLLTRGDLLSKVDGLWHLVVDHENRCGYELVGQLASRIRLQRDRKAVVELTRIIRYDQEFRTLLVKKSGIDRDILDFLFGRPMTDTLHGFGFHVEEETAGGRVIVRPR